MKEKTESGDLPAEWMWDVNLCHGRGRPCVEGGVCGSNCRFQRLKPLLLLEINVFSQVTRVRCDNLELPLVGAFSQQADRALLISMRARFNVNV